MAYSWLVNHVDILGLAIDFMALIVSIFLSVFIYRLERRHEKEREEAEERAQKLAIAEAAKVFLIDNDDEVDYLPLAAIAAKLKSKRKHCRDIITRYLRCTEQLQQEILRQTNIPNIQLSKEETTAALELLKADLVKYNFGRDIFYDGAKYLHYALERYADVSVDDIDPFIFEMLWKRKDKGRQPETAQQLSTVRDILYGYMYYYLHSEQLELNKDEITPPINMVFSECNLGWCHENVMTFWTMRIVIDACHAFRETQFDNISGIFDE